ncbi:MAG: prephenate dehydrogenase [Chitinophagaceae bacterium]|nr:prephenate dehydrogenase [Chitinophagaceae bacterium]
MMEVQCVTIIGVGLIGGSLAMRLKEKGIAQRIIGVDNNPNHLKTALELGLVDDVMALDEAIPLSDVIIFAIPVDATMSVLPMVLDKVDQQIVIDLGSTKGAMVNLIKNHPSRKRFVAAHPMWGTEYSGPEAAVKGAFEFKTVIVCNAEESDSRALDWAKEMFSTIGMNIMEMSAEAHDIHAAYISHIAHITSFALANTVLEKEHEDQAIFALASAGFESTVRLAKSNPQMWVPILKQNKENILDVLNEHITQLRKFKSCLEKENWDYLKQLMEQANKIKRIIK